MAGEAFVLEFEWRGRRFYDAAQGLNAVANHLGQKFDGVAGVITKELKGFLEDVAEALEKRHSQPWPGGTSERTLSKRSGFMIEEIKKSVTVSGHTIDTIEGTISVPFERRIHEHGGVIKPKQAKYLTIPLPAALDSRGVPLKKSAKDWEKTFVIKSKKGNLLIVQKQGVQIVPLYVLKTEVKIPPRLGLRTTVEAGMTMLADRLTDAILRSLLGSA